MILCIVSRHVRYCMETTSRLSFTVTLLGLCFCVCLCVQRCDDKEQHLLQHRKFTNTLAPVQSGSFHIPAWPTLRHEPLCFVALANKRRAERRAPGVAGGDAWLGRKRLTVRSSDRLHRSLPATPTSHTHTHTHALCSAGRRPVSVLAREGDTDVTLVK